MHDAHREYDAIDSRHRVYDAIDSDMSNTSQKYIIKNNNKKKKNEIILKQNFKF